MRIGIFPGTFDPIHEGHISFALATMVKMKLDKVFFLVEPRPHRKQGVRAFEHRIAMVQVVAQTDERLGVIVLDLARFAVESAWPKITARFDGAELYMVLGEDALHHIASWPQIGEFVALAPQFVIGIENEADKLELHDKLYTLQHTKAFPFMFHILEQPRPSVHSRTIRTSIKRGKVPSTISPAVAAYIAANGLYR